MSDPPADGPMVFEVIATCENPMEAEIYPAALRESEIPHRTEWKPSGQLVILVAQDWHQEAAQVLERAAKVFFGQTHSDSTDAQEPAAQTSRPESEAEQPEPGRQPSDEEEEANADAGRPFMGDALPTPDETRIRPVWPAWLLAAVPGLGLGHLYAGKPQMFFYLVFCSLLGVLFHQFTRSLWSFSLVAFAWAVDLGFAAYQVKQNNQHAIRARKRLAEAEQDFLESL